MSIFDHFSELQPTKDQVSALQNLETFLESDDKVFLLKGYAGTGKTTLLKGLVDYVQTLKYSSHLMAPTGRAASVIRQITGKSAQTIHKSIYSFNDLREIEVKGKDNELTYKYSFCLRDDQNLNADIFIIDEASMISDVYSEGEFFIFGSGYLLKDFIEYTKINNSNNNVKIIFIGDNAQLPPVGMNLSPALEESYLSKYYQIKAERCLLQTIVRQKGENPIMQSATNIRNSIRDQVFNTFDLKPDQQNILNINPEELVERYLENMDRSIIITYKNKTAKEWNQAIHKRRFPDTGHICSNEKVIVGRNNYHHNIFNGDFGVVIKASSNIDIRRTVPVVHENKKHQVVLEWRHVELLFLDEEQEEKVVKGYMLENFLNTDAPNLSSVEQKALFIDFKIRNSKLKPNTTEFKETISNDQLFNAIMIKYGYAVTCHKAQGGEWDNVFVIWDYNIQKDFNNYSLKDLIKGKTNENFYRWAYTAVTRAEKALYNVNPPFFNPFVNMDFVPSISIDQLRNMHGSKKKVLQIQWEDKHDQLIESLGLKETPDFLQKKAVELHHLLTERYIQIHKREGKPYQEVYTFIRDEKKAKMIFFYNKKNKFTKAKKVPSGTNSDEFYREIENTLNQPLKTEIIKNENTDKTETQYHYTPNFPDDKSFLKALYQKLVVPCKEKNIAIKKIDHIDYRERYEFVQYNGKAILDFVYDGKGFFTIVEEQEHTSPDLIIDLYEIIQNIKQ